VFYTRADTGGSLTTLWHSSNTHTHKCAGVWTGSRDAVSDSTLIPEAEHEKTSPNSSQIQRSFHSDEPSIGAVESFQPHAKLQSSTISQIEV